MLFRNTNLFIGIGMLNMNILANKCAHIYLVNYIMFFTIDYAF